MYKVIKYFTDLQDNQYAYNAGDTFPRKGKEVSKERLEELASANNKRKQPLIKLVKEKKAEEEPLEIPFADDTEEVAEEKPVKKTRGRKKNA